MYMFSTRIDNSNVVFTNKAILKTTYKPMRLSDILHRGKEINLYMDYMVDVFNKVSPSNIFIYGKSGLGKTLITQLVMKQLELEAESHNIDVCVIYLKCDELRTEFTILKSIIDKLPTPPGEKKRKVANALGDKYEYYHKLVDAYPGIIIIIFDELDKADKPEMINSIIRSTSAASGQSPTVIGITNDVNLKDSFPAHLQSVLCENQIFINPYDAEQLEDILRARIAEAFQLGVVTDEAIGLCAAYSAQDHEDARKAIELIRIAGEIVTIVGRRIVNEADVKEANVKINVDRVVKVSEPLPTQTKAVLFAFICVYNSPKENSTNNIHAVYTEIANAVGMETVAPRRMRYILTELDQLGVIDVENVNKGRKGRKKLVTAINSKEALVGVLLADYKLSAIADDDPSVFIRRI